MSVRDPLEDLLAPYGAAENTVFSLDTMDGAEARTRLDYHDLVQAEADERPDGVVRVNETTVAYVLRGEQLPDPQRVIRMRRMLAQRDDAPFLVVATPGQLAVYGVDLDRQSLDAARLEAIAASAAAAPATFRRLHQDPPGRDQARRQAIHDLLFKLLTTAIDGLHSAGGMSRADAIALSGRALLMRFLVDHGVLGGHRKSPGEVCPGATAWEGLFTTPERARSTSAWIDHTFAADLLPVSLFQRAEGDGLGDAALELLTAIMRRSSQVPLSFDRIDVGLDAPFAWDALDFAHIPVGVLSQVYEHQAERWDPSGRQRDSVYYTPRRLAEYMVREAFARLEVTKGRPPYDARVLDPAAGGGVFLVAAFRELAVAWHRGKGRWPTSRELRRILSSQLCGFDVQESAMSLASLSLLLTSIELDRPPYKFDELRLDRPLAGTVLLNVRDDGLAAGVPHRGSLGPKIGPEHRGRYDLVVGNPPWTSLRGKPGKQVISQATAHLRPLVAARLGDARAAAFAIPDNVPDLPFVWRAMEWARPHGTLAFALEGRLLFKSSEAGRRARVDLFDALTVWGVLNGTDLRNTPVWPAVSRPFCLMFADNALPPPDHAFFMLSPYFEPALNEAGRLRIDPEGVQPISPARLARTPTLLKTLFRGTVLDVDLLEQLERRKLPQLTTWWTSLGLATGAGYQTSTEKMDASILLGRPMLTPGARVGVLVDAATLPRFDRPRLHRVRDPAIYRGPQLLVREAVPTTGPWAHVCDDGVVFNESFHGYSAHGHPEGQLLVRYLALLLRSELFVWFNLVTGGHFGVERETWDKFDVDAFPIVPLADLTAAQRARIEPLFASLADGSLDDRALTGWIADVYGLGARASEVIADTLAVGLPHASNKQDAASTPEEAVFTAFAERLRREFAPFVVVDVRLVEAVPGDPYRVLVIGRDLPSADALRVGVQGLLELADRSGSSEFVALDQATRRIWLGRLAQHRYWTQSRARLTAARVLADHLESLRGE